MAKDRIEKNDVINPDVVKEIEDLNKELSKSVKIMTDLVKVSADFFRGFDPGTINEVTESQKRYNEVNEKSQTENKKTSTTLEKLQQKIKEVNEEEERAKIALQKKRKEVRDSIKAQKDQTKETVKLTRELQKEIKTEKEATEQNKRLLKVRKEVDTSTAKGALQVSQINKKIDQNNSLLKNNASQLGKQKIGIGKYKEGVAEALKEHEFFGLSINKVSAGLKSGLGVFGAVSAVVLGLGKAYMSSARGAEDMAKASDRLHSITKSLGNSLADATGEVSLFDSIVRTVQLSLFGLSNTILADVEVAILSQIRTLGILEKDQERQKKKQLQDAEELRQIRDEERNSLEERRNANDELGKVITAREEETIAFQEKKLQNYKALLALDEGNIEIQQAIKDVEFEIADAREEAAGFRSEQLVNDLALSREYYANELELQKLIVEGEINASEDKFNLRKKLVDITKQLELEAAGENEQLQNIAVQKAKNANEQITRDFQTELAKRYESELLDLENKELINEEKIEKALEDADLELERWIEQQEALTDIEIEEINKRALASIEADAAKKQSIREWVAFAANEAISLNNQIFGLLDAQNKAQEEADINKAKSRGASEEEILKIEKEYAEKRKSMAITQAIINTALGVTAALANPGGILGIVIAALVAVSGALEIAAISNAKFAKGTSDSGPVGMIATVGEKGTERINFADGTSAMTPNGATLTYLPPHSEVIPNHHLQQDLADMQSVSSRKKSGQENNGNKEDFKQFIRAIKNRDETNINITENGFSVTAKKGMVKYKYIDRKYRN